MESRPQKTSPAQKQTPENFIKDIRRKTRRIFSSEQKILIIMEALRGEDSVAAICRKHGIVESVFYKWNKEFLEAGKKRLAGDTTREVTSDQVVELQKENQRLKELVADLMLRQDILKKARSTWVKPKMEEVHALYRTRKRRDYPAGGSIGTWGEQNPSGVRHSQKHFLQLV